jgi:choloylglycine hydrolase
MRTIRGFSMALAVATLAASPASSCTTFSFTESPGRVVGKSFDWHQEFGRFFTNPRGLGKRAFLLNTDAEPAEWISRYGSLTMNQYGRETPIGGVNEKGLVVESMWLDETSHAETVTKPAVNELQWMQYQLDNFESVEEAVLRKDDLEIVPVYGMLHYLMCDDSGVCAVFEFLKGKVNVETTSASRPAALANSRYRESLDFLRTLVGFGGVQPIPPGSDSLARFARAALAVRNAAAASTKSPVADAFRTLDSVRASGQERRSVWNNVWDRAEKKVHFRTWSDRTLRSVSWDKFDFSCAVPAKTLPIDRVTAIGESLGPEGDVTDKFADYTTEKNLALAKLSLKHLENVLPDGTIEAFAAYPSKLPCLVP